MSSHLQMCEIPQFENPMEVRVWVKKKISESIKFSLELEHRKIREEKWLKNMKEKQIVYKLTKDVLDLELEEYFIPDTPNSCVSCSCCSTRGISQGNSLFNTVSEDYLYHKDGYISSDSIDNFDTFKLSPAMSPNRKELLDNESLTNSDVEIDDWNDIKNVF